MSDNEETPQRERKPLGLKRSVGEGEVKQTFSHGRTNKVVVEVKRRKLIGKPGAPEAAPPPAPAPAPEPAPVVAAPAPSDGAGATEHPGQTPLLSDRQRQFPHAVSHRRDDGSEFGPDHVLGGLPLRADRRSGQLVRQPAHL